MPTRSCSQGPEYEGNDYPLDLRPLKHSHEYDVIEQELKGLFIDLFEETLRAKERDMNVYGMPHLGSFELVSRFVKEDGLALINNDDEEAMRYLYKAWAGRNPRQGLHFLRTYLQLLWPNRSGAHLVWYRKDSIPQYPVARFERFPFFFPANEDPEDGYFLTCRVVALVEFDGDPAVRGVIEPALRATLAAEFVLELRPLVITNTSAALVGGLAFNTLWTADIEVIDPVDSSNSGYGYGAAFSHNYVFNADFKISDPLLIEQNKEAMGSSLASPGQLLNLDITL